MQIFNSLDQLNIEDKTSVALGNFDGIHVGHREIMQNAIETAKERGLRSLCFTFSNHPFNFILRREDSDPDAVKLICTEEEKIALIEEMGFDILVNVPFDERIMKMRAHGFFEDIVRNKLNAGHVSVGFNYTYGARAEGKPEMLRDECEKAGISISIHEAVVIMDRVVSSTLIREKIAEGDVESAAMYLGRSLSYQGVVEHGNSIGHEKGFPTANIRPSRSLALPPYGVYFCRTKVDEKEYKSICNIGVKPTIKRDDPVTIETFIFDFDGMIYGKNVTVYLDHFSRPEKTFDSRDRLFEQIRQDCENAREFYITNNHRL